MYLLENNITKFSTASGVTIDNSKDLFSVPLSSVRYVNLPFFTNWIIGFTIAEGSFYIKNRIVESLYDNDHILHCLKHSN